MPGSAVIEAHIEGVLHEYSGIEGVQEDVMEILLNLKDLAIAMHKRDAATLSLKKKGPGQVTGRRTYSWITMLRSPTLIT